MRSLAMFVFGIIMVVAIQCGDPGVQARQTGNSGEIYRRSGYRFIDREAGVVCYEGAGNGLVCFLIEDTNLDIGE
jgi:hypothetical protein